MAVQAASGSGRVVMRGAMAVRWRLPSRLVSWRARVVMARVRRLVTCPAVKRYRRRSGGGVGPGSLAAGGDDRGDPDQPRVVKRDPQPLEQRPLHPRRAQRHRVTPPAEVGRQAGVPAWPSLHAVEEFCLGERVAGAGEFAPEGDGGVAGGGDDDVVVDAVVGEEVEGEAVVGGGDGVEEGGEGAAGVAVGCEVVVAVGVDAAEEVDDVEAEVVGGAGVAAGELLVCLGGVLGVQGHGLGGVEDLVDVDEVDVVVAGPGEHGAEGGVGVGVSGGRWRCGAAAAKAVRGMSVQRMVSAWPWWRVAVSAKLVA